VLNFLASHPGESFTLSGRSRHLILNMASGLSVLKALTDADFVRRRHSHETCSSGPALVLVVVGVGCAALARYPVIEIAIGEMRRVAADSDTECVPSVVVGDEIVLVDASGSGCQCSRRSVPSSSPGMSRRASSAGSTRWGRGPTSRNASSTATHWRPCAGVASRWAASSRGTGPGAGAPVGPRQLAARGRLPGKALGLIAAVRHDSQVIDLDSTARILISNMTAPVFGVDGEVVQALTLQGFDEPMKRAGDHCYPGDRLLFRRRT